MKKSEFDAAVSTAAGVALFVAVGLHRSHVTSRFVPGLGDSVLVRLALPLALGIGIATTWAGLNTLLRVPVVREKTEAV